MRHVVVLGGGFGGVSAVNSLIDGLTPRRRVKVSLISASDRFLFTPLLPNAATGDISPDTINIPIADAVGDRVNVEVDQITDIDLERRVLKGHLEYPYEALILSPGSDIRWPESNDAFRQHCLSCKTVDDARAIRERIDIHVDTARHLDEAEARAYMCFVVIGGGPTGVTLMAEIVDYVRQVHLAETPSLASLVRFVLIDKRRRLLADMPAELAQLCKTQLERMGVEIQSHTTATDVTATMVETARERIATRNVFWCGGVQGAKWLENTGLPLDHDGRIRVDEHLRVLGQTAVYAVGDAASGPWPWSAQVATQQAQTAARNVLADLTGRTWTSFEYAYEGDILSLGQNNAAIYYRGVAFEGRAARTLHRVLYTALAPAGVRKMMVFRDWIAAGFKKPQARLRAE